VKLCPRQQREAELAQAPGALHVQLGHFTRIVGGRIAAVLRQGPRATGQQKQQGAKDGKKSRSLQARFSGPHHSRDVAPTRSVNCLYVAGEPSRMAFWILSL